MDKLTYKIAKRFDLMVECAKKYGCQNGNTYTISLWELAFNLNNTWKAKYFLSTTIKNRHSQETLRNSKQWAIKDTYLYLYFRPIKDALEKCGHYPFLFKAGANGVDYLILSTKESEGG